MRFELSPIDIVIAHARGEDSRNLIGVNHAEHTTTLFGF